MLRNTPDAYGSVSKTFHWLVALLVILMLAGGLSLNYIPKGELKKFVITAHESTGVTILVLMVLRLSWRLTDPLPPMPAHVPWIQYIAARVSHSLFYILLIVMPLSGWIMATAAGFTPHFYWVLPLGFPGIDKNETLKIIASNTHTTLAWTIFILVLIHTSAALFHHFVYKDNVLRRMLPRWRQ